MNDRTHLLAATSAACLLLVFTALPCRAASAPGAKGGIPQLKPELGHTHDISPHAQKNFERGKALLEEIKAKKTSWDALSPEENALAAEAEMMKSIWKTYEPACSWYCGGGPEGYPTSSALLPAGKINYDAKNIHDFDLSTAWVQGKAGPGIGEYVEFRFPPALRVNKVLFYNGHQKSEAAPKSSPWTPSSTVPGWD